MEHTKPEHVSSQDIDAELLLRSARGDPRAFDALVARNRRRVLNITYRYVGDGTEAEDLTQDAFVQLYRSRSRYRPTARFSTFLNRVVVNLCINERRRRKRRPTEALDDGRREPPTREDGPEQVAAQHELSRQVLVALQRLPDKQRMAAILVHYDGASHGEAAEAIGCSAKAVEGLLHRARQALSRQLRGYVGEDA